MSCGREERGVERVSGGSGRWAAGLVRHLVVWIVAMVVGTIGAFPVLAMGLVVPGQVIGPLSFCAGAALATVGAYWAGTILDRGRTRGRLAPILGVGLSTAVVVSAVDLAARLVGGNLVAISNGGALLLGLAVIALNVSIATWRFRRAGHNLRRDAFFTLLLLGLTLAAVVAAIFSTCTLWYCSG